MSLSLATQNALRAPVPIRRELLVLAAALACGALVAPPLLWVAASRTLGPYAGGGIGVFLASFYRGLASGTLGFWLVALMPYPIILVARALIALARATAAR